MERPKLEALKTLVRWTLFFLTGATLRGVLVQLEMLPELLKPTVSYAVPLLIGALDNYKHELGKAKVKASLKANEVVESKSYGILPF